MNNFINFFYFLLLVSGFSHSATVTSSLSGSVIECTQSGVAFGCSTTDTFQHDFSFDDSFYGMTLALSDIQSITQTNISSVAGIFINDITGLLTSLSLSIDDFGQITGGGYEVNQSIANDTYISIYDLSGFVSGLGTNLLWASSVNDGISLSYLGGGCFDGFGPCGSPIPLPASIYLFTFALLNISGLRLFRHDS